VSLRKWTNRVIDIRARELSVSADRSNALRANTFSRWRAITVRHAEDLSLVDSFVEVQDEQLSKRYFRRWLTKARRDRALRALLKQKLQDDEQALIVGCFDRWTDRLRENQLIQEVNVQSLDRRAKF
jgi:protein SFI1